MLGGGLLAMLWKRELGRTWFVEEAQVQNMHPQLNKCDTVFIAGTQTIFTTESGANPHMP